MVAKQLGVIIRNRRKELGLKQAQLAELAEISTNTLYKLEHGESNPTLDVINSLGKVLGFELNIEMKRNTNWQSKQPWN